MRKSIFDIELRVDINKEFQNIKKVLFENGGIYYDGLFRTPYSFFNDYIIPSWKDKGLFIDLDDFVDKMNIDFTSNNCNENEILDLLELFINIWPISIKKIGSDFEESVSDRVSGYMSINVPLIIEKLNYQIIEDNGKFRIIKRDSDVDSILDIVSHNYANLLLAYNDIRNNNINDKKKILKEIDLYIEENLKKYKGNPTYESIGSIVNNLGINHPIKKKFQSFTEEELCIWYDKCFKLMIHLIRSEEVSKINEDRNKIFINNGE